MTIRTVKECVAEIQALADDDGMAHAKEDELMTAFITLIANENSKYSKMARLILSTSDIHFHRWCE